MIPLDTKLGQAVKRAVDVVGSAIGLLVLGPFLVLTAAVIKLDSPGPVFFRQERVGRKGSVFRIWKFRSMRMDADQEGPAITSAGDSRVSRVGRVLRATKIDELPQLINVLRGEMSLVGPRPEVPFYVALYRPEDRGVLDVRPGITDPASLKYRNEEAVLAEAEDPLGHYEAVVMREKIRLNLEYQRSATVMSDFRVLLHTIHAVLFGSR